MMIRFLTQKTKSVGLPTKYELHSLNSNTPKYVVRVVFDLLFYGSCQALLTLALKMNVFINHL